MKWGILTRSDIKKLNKIGEKLKAGTKKEQALGRAILLYTKDRIPIPTKDYNIGKSGGICKNGKEMFPDSEAADEALAH